MMSTVDKEEIAILPRKKEDPSLLILVLLRRMWFLNPTMAQGR
jgi:hypothetical protein